MYGKGRVKRPKETGSETSLLVSGSRFFRSFDERSEQGYFVSSENRRFFGSLPATGEGRQISFTISKNQEVETC